MNIQEVRSKYPQYSDLSDSQLADVFHAKYYSDIPKADYYAKIGLNTEQPKSKPVPDQQLSTLDKLLAKVPSRMSIPTPFGMQDINLASDKPYRFAQGAADPTIGAAQLAANLVGQGDGINKFVKQREATMPEGFDPIRLAGSFASPFAFASKVAPAATTLGRASQGAKFGLASGLTNPVSRDDYASSKTMDALFGTAMGGALPLGWEGVKAGGRVGRSIIDAFRGENGAKDIAGRMLYKAGGEKTDDIIRQLELGMDSPVPGMQWNAGQKAAPVGSAEFSALIDIANKRAGSTAIAQQNAQKEAVKRLMQTVSRSDDPNARQAAMDQLNALTGPMRIAAIENANIAGRLVPKLESQINQKTASKIDALKNYGQLATESVQQQVRGNALKDAFLGPRQMAPGAQNRARGAEYFEGAMDFGNVAQQRQAEKNFRQFQLDSLAQHGNFPLLGSEIYNKIESRLVTPGDEASDAIVKSLSPLRDKIARLTNNNGVIRAENLHTIRKEINDDLAAVAKSNNWSDQRVRSIALDVKGYIDEAFDKAGAGDLWQSFLKTHAQGMRGVNDITIGRELEKSLFSGSDKLTKESFMAAMDKATQNPDVLRQVGAARMGNIEKAMTPPAFQKMSAIDQALQRNADFERLASAGMPKAMEISGLPHLPQTGILNNKIGLARSALNRFIGYEHGNVLDQIAKATPEQIAEMMKKATPAQRQMLLDHFFRGQALATGQLPN